MHGSLSEMSEPGLLLALALVLVLAGQHTACRFIVTFKQTQLTLLSRQAAVLSTAKSM